MKPELFAGRDGGEARQIINGAAIDRTRGSNHPKRRQARIAILQDRRLERVDIDLMQAVGGNDMQRRAAEAGQIHGL